MKSPKFRHETIEEYLDRGETITRCPPSVARNYLTDDAIFGLLIGYRFDELDRDDTEIASTLHEVRDVQRDARVTDAEWN
jgi:hypothetical protein